MADHFKNMLYVDDEKNNLVVLRSAFRRDFNVFTAESAYEGLSILEKEDIQVIVTDQRMPGKTGVEFLESTLEKYPDTVKLILTGFSDIEVIIQAINKVNLFSYVQKPWDKDHLKKILDNAFESYWLKKDNQELLEDLQTALTELNVFLYRASHDLRGPITRMIGLAQVAKLEDIDSTAKTYFDKFESSALGLQKVLDKLVVMKSINDTYTEKHKVNFENIFNKINSKHYKEVKQADIEVSFKQNPGINLYSNQELIEYLLLYLFENAVQFRDIAKSNRHITIDIDQKDAAVTIKISDNGTGITSVHQPKVFDMFYRGTEKSEGSGLGLYIANRIVAQLKGNIELRSEPGQGTEIEIKLPLE